jgi:hypothetical protein
LTGLDPAVGLLDCFGSGEVRWRGPRRRGGKTA